MTIIAIPAATMFWVLTLSMSLCGFSTLMSLHPLECCDACPRHDEADVPVMYPGWAEDAAPYWAGDEAVLGECIGEFEVLPERGDEADDEGCPEYEAAASKH